MMRRLLILLALPLALTAQTPRKQQIRSIVRDTACAPARGWIARETTFTTLTAARTFGQRNPLFCPVVPPPPPPPPPADTTPPPPPPPPPVVVPAGAFLESFTGQPTTPQPFRSPLWDVLQFTTTAGGPVQVNPTAMLAQHAHDCAAPPATHLITTYAEQVFICRDHLMTAVSEEGNGGIVLTPARMLNFAGGEQVLSWRQNLEEQSGRDWWVVWVTPYNDVLQAPVFPDDGVAAMNGTPRNAIILDAEAGNPCAVLVVDYIRTRLPCSTYPAIKDRFPVSFTTREQIEVRISQTRIRVSIPERGITFVDAAFPQPLAWSQGVVQLGHYSYNPTKDNQRPNPQPNTWHWDEVFISNAVPFSLIAADRRDLTNENGPVTVTFAAPAPAGATLRMIARGARPEVSLDNGATWRVPPLAQYSFFDEPNEQYVLPVPQGLQSIRIRRGAQISWWPGNAGWFVRGFSIWAR
jgi:hypothetical protein